MTMLRRTVMKSLALFLAAALLSSCDPFDLRDVLEAASRSVLSLDPRDVEMPTGATIRFTADGGVPPYAYSSTGDGSIDPDTGDYTADLSAGSATITVTDAAGATTYTQVDAVPPLSGLHIVPSSITVVVSADVTFAAVGGTPPYTYAVTAIGSGLPVIDSGLGDYTAGSSIGVDQVTVTDALAFTATATINVVALTSAVDYDVTSVLALPSLGVAGSPIGAGTFTVQNVGAGNGAAPVGWKVYLSANAVLDGGDLVVDEGSVAALAAGGSIVVPLSGSWPTAPTGAGFLVVSLDAVDDTTPGNDTQSSAFTLEPRPVDYDVLSVTWTSGEYTGQAVDGSFSFKNVGSVAGASTVYWYVYASVDTVVGVGDYLLQGGSRPAMAAGETDGYPIDAVWPTTPNPYRLIVKVWAVDDILPGNDTEWTSAIGVTGEPPANVDYQAAAPVNTGFTVAGGDLDGTFLLSNTGSDAGSQTVNWIVYLSSNAVLDLGTDPVAAAGTHVALAGSGSDTVPFDGTWPSSAGTWWLFVAVSAGDDVDPLDNSSSGTAVPVTAPNVDYVIQTFAETSGLVAGDPILGDFRIRNSGTSAGAQPLGWTVYLSQDATLDPVGDLVVDAGTLAALGAGASSAITSYDGTWPVVPAAPWTWRLYLVADAADEVDTSDNTSAPPLVRTTVAPQADYDVMTVTHTAGTTAGQAFTGTFTVKNLGPHDGTQAVPWSAWLSTDAVYDVGVDTLVDTGVTPSLAFNTTSAGIPFDGTWPAGAASWYLVIVVDAGDDPAPGNDWAASGVVPVTAPNVNYDVLVVSNTGATTAGGPLAGEFTVKNIGTYAGNRTVYWTAYRSDDAILVPGPDPVIDSGTTTALGPGVTSSAIPFTNTWPGAIVVKNYHLFVRVFVTDDILATDDTGMSGMVVVNPPNIDYIVSNVSVAAVLRIPDQPVNGTFRYGNDGANAGSPWQTINWEAFASRNATIDVDDVLIDSGTGLGALPSSGESVDINWDGFWPLTFGDYFILVRVSCAEDVSTLNNVGQSVVQTNVGVYDETTMEPNSDYVGLTNPALLGVVVRPGMSLKIVNGAMSNADRDDVFQFNTGTASRIVVTVQWSINDKNVRIWFMDGPGNFIDGVSGLSGSMSLDWAVDAASVNRWIDLDNYWSGSDYTPPPNPVSLTYTCWITVQ
jgi:hypothetical protein